MVGDDSSIGQAIGSPWLPTGRGMRRAGLIAVLVLLSIAGCAPRPATVDVTQDDLVGTWIHEFEDGPPTIMTVDERDHVSFVDLPVILSDPYREWDPADIDWDTRISLDSEFPLSDITNWCCQDPSFLVTVPNLPGVITNIDNSSSPIELYLWDFSRSGWGGDPDEFRFVRVPAPENAWLDAAEVVGEWRHLGPDGEEAEISLGADGLVTVSGVPRNALPTAPGYGETPQLSWDEPAERTGTWEPSDPLDADDPFVWVSLHRYAGGVTYLKIRFDLSDDAERANLWWGPLEDRQELWFDRVSD